MFGNLSTGISHLILAEADNVNIKWKVHEVCKSQ